MSLLVFENTPLDVSDAFTMYLDVIWWIKKSKLLDIVNFTRTSEIFDCILSIRILWYSQKIGTRVDFLKLEFSILIVWPPNFFWEMFEYIQNFCHGDFFIYFVQMQKIDFFWRELLFFQVLREIHFSIKMIDLVFTLKVTVTFVWWKIFWSIYGKFLLFVEHIHLNVCNTFGMYLDAIWWSKKLKSILSYCKIHQNIRYFWQWSNPIFLKLNFSLLIVLLSIFWGEYSNTTVLSLFKVLFQFDFIFWKKFKMIYHLNPPCPPCPARHKTRNSKSILEVKNTYLCKSISKFSIVGLTTDWCIAKST